MAKSKNGKKIVLVPIPTIWVVDGHSFFFMCACGFGGPSLAREQAMASHRYFFSLGAYELCLLLLSPYPLIKTESNLKYQSKS